MSLACKNLFILTLALPTVICDHQLAERFKESGCAQQWNAMIKEREQKFSGTKSPVFDDDDGYVLAATHSDKTIWVYFQCKAVRLVHTHCRYGRSGEADFLKIPVGKYLEVVSPEEDSKRLNHYYACVESMTDNIRAFIKDELTFPYDEHKLKLQKCSRVKGSECCGTPSDIAARCLNDWLRVQNGHSMDETGALMFKDPKTPQTCATYAKFSCGPDGRLILDECQIAWSPNRFKPGEFLQFDGFFNPCPKRQSLNSDKLISGIAKMFQAAENKESKQLKGLTQALPKGFEMSQDCTSAWEKITDKGSRYFEMDGTVIVAWPTLLSKERENVRFSPSVYAKFACKNDKLILYSCKSVEVTEFADKTDRKDVSLDDCRTMAAKGMLGGY